MVIIDPNIKHFRGQTLHLWMLLLVVPSTEVLQLGDILLLASLVLLPLHGVDKGEPVLVHHHDVLNHLLDGLSTGLVCVIGIQVMAKVVCTRP